jgi:succinate dehydrogenase (ubiquinone) cytochrome b560 subunit
LCSPPVAVTKTPIQEWGWSYLVRQKALKRPISPHLSVYKPMLTWMVSGAHRVGGMAMGKLGCVQHSANVVACGGVIVVSTLMVAPFDFTDCVVRVKSWELPRVLIGAFKFIVALPIVFHTLNGIRFLVRV